MKKLSGLSSCLILLFMTISAPASAVTSKTAINYTVTFPEAQAHYANIEMTISGIKNTTTDVKMPVWTPGSYLVREFAKSVEGFAAFAGGKEIPAIKITKNTWRISNGKASSIKIVYKVYAFEISVRTAFIDASHAFLSTSGMFMYPADSLHAPSTIHIKPYKGWTTVSTSLDHVGDDPFTLYSPNYDILFDSPIEVGTQDVFGFDAAGVKYEVAMCGGGNYNREQMKIDLAKIVEAETAIYHENPNKRYVFIVHNYVKGGGGLEHLSSTVLGAVRDGYATEGTYHNFLSLAAHEHFHLWNVKRLRPIALGPFDYDTENYTRSLWIAEGFTTYYQNVIMRRAGLYKPDEYLGVVAANITSAENLKGNKTQSLSDASFDAWIKYYRPTENTPNTNASYYGKGANVAMLLDLEIIRHSKGAQCLDDVMKYMYDEFYKVKQRGYTEEEFKATLEKYTGVNLDDFYQKYVSGLAPLDYDRYLGYAGYKLVDDYAANNIPTLGVTIVTGGGKSMVTGVMRDGAGWIDGINVNDEITAIDGAAIPEIDKFIAANKKVGDKISVSVIRDGQKMVLPVTLLRNPGVKYHIEDKGTPTAEMLAVRKKWMHL
ncbi:peptidase M61 [Mucilaginibacter sp. PPCGB 2223]|nr:peptidase M61 [Mucilaginibacter sp. PPCGB 2223]